MPIRATGASPRWGRRFTTRDEAFRGAIVVTLLVTACVYALVAFVAVAAAGPAGLADTTLQAAAPLEVIARGFATPAVAWVVAALFPRWVAVAGLLCCVGLSFFVEPEVWISGFGLLLLGLFWHVVAQRSNRAASAG